MERIIVVEDDIAVATGLEVILRGENYDVVVANDGEIGFELCKNENFDLIILDIMLPEKDGIEICRELRSVGVPTPILMLTSKKEKIDKVLGLGAGADDYVTKPFSVGELLARIKALLRR